MGWAPEFADSLKIMPLIVSYPIQEKGNTVPYPPLQDMIRTNAGFVNTQGRPELVHEIPEVHESPALGRILTLLANRGASFISLGCDLGDHVDNEQPNGWRRVSGGYVQIACADYGTNDVERLKSICKYTEKVVGGAVGGRHWKIEFSIAAVRFEIDREVDTHSVWVWFFASSSSRTRARQSRECLIESISRAIETFVSEN